MSAGNYHDLRQHVGHEIECVTYGDDQNVAIECLNCSEVLLDFDRPPATLVCPNCGHTSKTAFISPPVGSRLAKCWNCMTAFDTMGD